jgi:hypothetical protein
MGLATEVETGQAKAPEKPAPPKASEPEKYRVRMPGGNIIGPFGGELLRTALKNGGEKLGTGSIG